MSPVIVETGRPAYVGDLAIQEWIHDRYGFVPHPFWIDHCRELYVLGASGPTRSPRHECPPDQRPAIKAAFVHFGILPE